MSVSPLAGASGRIETGAGAAAAVIRARAAEWDAPLVEEETRLTLQLWGCELRLIPDAPGARVEITGAERRLVLTLQDSATQMLADEGVAILWDSVALGALAPGLALMRVASVRPLSAGYLRVRLTGPEAARFALGSLHFRLLLPPEGRAPCWPRIAESGRAVWPTGADALHRPVYTVTAQADDWLEFDIFRHAGSPTCDWADRVQPGAEVGIIGPGGGWCPDARVLHLLGDETALPAIARMLSLAQGTVHAFVRASGDDLGPLVHDPRVTRCDDLLGALHDLEVCEQSHVWFAARDDEARAARRCLLDRGVAKTAFTAAAYWSRGAAPAD